MISEPFWLIGLIFAIFFGWAMSSYTSSFIYRLPRGEDPLGRKPYCGDCNTLLKPIDLFPIFSWLMTGGKCRYCGAKVPASYCVVELCGTLSFAYFYTAYGFHDMFLVMASVFALLVIQMMMVYDDDYHSPLITLLIGGIGVVATLVQGKLLGDALINIFFGFILGILLYNVRTPKEQRSRKMKEMPDYVWLSTVAGAWLELPALMGFLAAWYMVRLLLKKPWEASPKKQLYVSYCVTLFVVLIIAYRPV